MANILVFFALIIGMQNLKINISNTGISDFNLSASSPIVGNNLALSLSQDYLSINESFSTSIITNFDCDRVENCSPHGGYLPDITKINNKSYNIVFNDTTSIGEVEYNFNAYDNSNIPTPITIYRYVGGDNQAISLSSIYDAKSKYYLNHCATDEDLINLGITDNPNNLVLEKSSSDSLIDFQNFVYGFSNSLYEYSSHSYMHYGNNCLCFKGTFVGYRGNSNTFPLRGFKVVLGEDPTFDNSVYTYTDELGCFEIFYNSEEDFEDLSLYILSTTKSFKVSPDFRDSYELVVSLNDALFTPATTNEFIISIDLSRDEDIIQAFDVAAAAQLTGDFYFEMEGISLDEIDIVYPYSGFENCGYYQLEFGTERYIHLKKGFSDQWDVITHEVGHYICNFQGACNYEKGKHSFSWDLCNVSETGEELPSNASAEIKEMARNRGLRLAYSEGLATSIGILAQIYFSDYSPLVYSFADEVYTDYSSSNSFEMDYSLFKCGREFYGEGFEGSVTSFILKCFDNVSRSYDTVSFTFEDIWNVLMHSRHETFSDFVYDLLDSYPEKAEGINLLLSKEGFSPILNGYYHLLTLHQSSSNLFYSWNINGTGSCHPAAFKIIFESDHPIYNRYETNFIYTTSYTLTNEENEIVLRMSAWDATWKVCAFKNSDGYFQETYTSEKQHFVNPINRWVQTQSNFTIQSFNGSSPYIICLQLNNPSLFTISTTGNCDLECNIYEDLSYSFSTQTPVFSNSNSTGNIHVDGNSSNYQKLFVVITLRSGTGGTFNLQLILHTYSYQPYSSTDHRVLCSCGDSFLERHVIASETVHTSFNGHLYGTCRYCGALVDLGNGDIFISNAIGYNYLISNNGSYLLNNGIIILQEEDYELFEQNSLIFHNPSEVLI